MGWGLPPALAQRLIDMGPAACDYFEHCFPELMWLNGHRREGCHLCKQEESFISRERKAPGDVSATEPASNHLT